MIQNYKDARSILVKLRRDFPGKVHIYFGVDAMDLSNHDIFGTFLYDLIQFNFPHGFEKPTELETHKKLLEGFFSQAADRLKEGGLVRVLIMLTPPYALWNVLVHVLVHLLCPMHLN